jgi:hypothetical protein
MKSILVLLGYKYGSFSVNLFDIHLESCQVTKCFFYIFDSKKTLKKHV